MAPSRLPRHRGTPDRDCGETSGGQDFADRRPAAPEVHFFTAFFDFVMHSQGFLHVLVSYLREPGRNP
jgi:hypothetical protein